MNPQDPLAALHPLREPAAIGWWPPAPGWWALAALLLVALLGLAWFLLRRYRARAYRRRALALLAQLQGRYRQAEDAGHLLAETNALLKSVALHAYPRRDIAALWGPAWLAFLNAGLKPAEQFPGELASAAYRRDVPAIDPAQLERAARCWIRRHEAPK